VKNTFKCQCICDSVVVYYEEAWHYNICMKQQRSSKEIKSILEPLTLEDMSGISPSELVLLTKPGGCRGWRSCPVAALRYGSAEGQWKQTSAEPSGVPTDLGSCPRMRFGIGILNVRVLHNTVTYFAHVSLINQLKLLSSGTVSSVAN
jgi:hypothetical protein